MNEENAAIQLNIKYKENITSRKEIICIVKTFLLNYMFVIMPPSFY